MLCWKMIALESINAILLTFFTTGYYKYILCKVKIITGKFFNLTDEYIAAYGSIVLSCIVFVFSTGIQFSTII